MTDALSKLNEIESKEILENEIIKNILTKEKERFKTITVAGQQIKIRPTIPRNLRHELQRLQDRDNADIEGIEEDMYRVISEMCLEEPFNKAAVWRYLDQETGCIVDVLTEIYNQALATDKQLKKFR